MPAASALDTDGLRRSIKQRLKEIDRELAGVRGLLAEKERLEAALERLQTLDGPRAERARRPAADRASSRRRPRGQSRELALSFLAELGRPATATEVSDATGLNRGSVSTLLSSLARAGTLEKRERGYALPAGTDTA